MLRFSKLLKFKYMWPTIVSVSLVGKEYMLHNKDQSTTNPQKDMLNAFKEFSKTPNPKQTYADVAMHGRADVSLPSPDLTHIIMIRHAETIRNAVGKEIQGWIDDDAAQLNTKGQSQANELGKALANHYKNKISIIYSSPLGRCIETSELIAHYFNNLLILKEQRLREICHGQHDTMPFKERNEFCLQRYVELEKAFKDQFPNKELDRFFRWEINPLSERAIPLERIEKPLGGELETVFQLFTRATSVIEEIGKKHPGETVLVCSHAALIKTLSDEAEYRTKKDQGPLPVYYEPKSTEPKSHALPGNCVVYHFVWHEGILTFTGTEKFNSPEDDLSQQKPLRDFCGF